MRRTRDSGEKGKKTLVYLIGFIMISSVFGVIFFGYNTDGTTTAKYNGFKFINKGGFLSTNVNGREVLFSYFPSDVELIPIDSETINRLKDKLEVDVTSEFNDTLSEAIALAQFQMGITLNNFNAFVRNGFTSENPSNFQIITCRDSTDFVPVIYFRSSNETRIYLKNDCIIAEAASDVDVIRIKDRLVYGILGIIK